MSKEHSPAPWYIQRVEGTPLYYIISDGPDNRYVVAKTGQIGNCKADAQLIARAPELLAENAALRSSLQAVADYLRDKPATDMPAEVAEIILKFQNESL